MIIAASILGGLIVLTLGAEFLVRGAVRLAERFGVSPLLIGLTVVGFGTSTPELVTSIRGALAGSPGIAVGNIVGSNIFNVLVILGLAAIIAPLAVRATALRRDGVMVIATTLLFVLVGWLWTLDRVVGLGFLALLAGYLTYAYRQERAPADGHTAAFDKGQALGELDPAARPAPQQAGGWVGPVLLVLGGLGMLVVGSGWFVGGAIELARLLGVSETLIGLTIVAAGTSMPELATSALAAIRRQTDVAIGNILGSNIYNILGIGGVTALIAPTAIPPEIVSFDNLVMLGVAVALMALMFTGRRVSRIEGTTLLAAYGVYVWSVFPATAAP